MELRLNVCMENDAFCDEGGGAELARVLRQVAQRIETEGVAAFRQSQTLRDINGNDVGRAKVLGVPVAEQNAACLRRAAARQRIEERYAARRQEEQR